MPENDSIIPSIAFTAKRKGDIKSLARDIASYNAQSGGETIDPNLLGIAYNVGVTNSRGKNKSALLNRLVNRYTQKNHLSGEGSGYSEVEPTILTGTKREAKKAARYIPYLTDSDFEERFGFSPYELNSGAPLKFVNNRGKDITKKFMRPYDRNLARAYENDTSRAKKRQSLYNMRRVGGEAGEQAMMEDTISGREKLANDILKVASFAPLEPWGIGAGLAYGVAPLVSMSKKYGGNGFNAGQFFTGLGLTALSALPFGNRYINLFGMPSWMAAARSGVAGSSFGQAVSRFGSAAARRMYNTARYLAESPAGKYVTDAAKSFASTKTGKALSEMYDLTGDLIKGLNPEVDYNDLPSLKYNYRPVTPVIQENTPVIQENLSADTASAAPAAGSPHVSVETPTIGFLDAENRNPAIMYTYNRANNTIEVTYNPFDNTLMHNYGTIPYYEYDASTLKPFLEPGPNQIPIKDLVEQYNISPESLMKAGVSKQELIANGIDPLSNSSGRRFVEDIDTNNSPDRALYGQTGKYFKNLNDSMLPLSTDTQISALDLTQQIRLIGDEIARGDFDKVLGISRYEGMPPIKYTVRLANKPDSKLFALEQNGLLSLPKPDASGNYAITYNGVINNDYFKVFNPNTGEEIPLYDASGNRVHRIVNPEIQFVPTDPHNYFPTDVGGIFHNSLDPKVDLGVDLDLFSTNAENYIRNMNAATRSFPEGGFDFVPGLSSEGGDKFIKGMTGNMEKVVTFPDSAGNILGENEFTGGFTKTQKSTSVHYTPAMFRTDGVRNKDLITITIPNIDILPTFYDYTNGKLRFVPNQSMYGALAHEFLGHFLDNVRGSLDALGVEFRDAAGNVIPYLQAADLNIPLQLAIDSTNNSYLSKHLMNGQITTEPGYFTSRYFTNSGEVNGRLSEKRFMKDYMAPHFGNILYNGSIPFNTNGNSPIAIPGNFILNTDMLTNGKFSKGLDGKIYPSFDNDIGHFRLFDIYNSDRGITSSSANLEHTIPFLNPRFGNPNPYDLSVHFTKPHETEAFSEATRRGYRKGGSIGFTPTMLRRARSFFARGGVMDGQEPPETTDYSGYTGDQMYGLLGMDINAFNNAIRDTYFKEPYITYEQTLDFNNYTPLYRNPLNSSGRLALLHTNRLNTINRMFAEAGIGPVQRAALLASIIHESKGDPANVDKKNGFYGLIQWSAERFPDFEKHKNDLVYQVNKIISELKTMPAGSWSDGATGGKVVKHANEGRWEFFRATDPYEAAFYLNKCYIRPYSSDKHKDNTANRLAAYDNRGKEAKNIFSLFNL